MENYKNTIIEILIENNGELVGKTRLQKTVYFLQELQLVDDFEFSYHHYGPFSDIVASSMNRALYYDEVCEVPKVSSFGNNIISYQVNSNSNSNNPARVDVLNTLKSYSSVVLELAATALFLDKNGFKGGSWDETAIRKAGKVTPQRITDATNLLQELKLNF